MAAMQRMMVWLCGLVVAFGFIAGCGPQTDSFNEFGFSNDTAEFEQASDTGTKQLPVAQAGPPPTYNLPFMSGLTYSASTYAGHGNAWDFNNLSGGNNDCGEPVLAVTNGRVKSLYTLCHDTNSWGCQGGAGNYVCYDHDVDGNQSCYFHMQLVYVVVDQWVSEGQVLGRMGSSGNSTACHIHHEVRVKRSTASIPANYVWQGGSGSIVNGRSYLSRNHAKIDSMKVQLGSANVGNQRTATAEQISTRGYKLEYTGGSFGDNTIYYETAGCAHTDGCPSYNNTNFAWGVRGGIRATYNAMGGPYSWLGFPTGNEEPSGNGQRQTFRYGYLYWDRRTGVTSAHSY